MELETWFPTAEWSLEPAEIVVEVQDFSINCQQGTHFDGGILGSSWILRKLDVKSHFWASSVQDGNLLKWARIIAPSVVEAPNRDLAIFPILHITSKSIQIPNVLNHPPSPSNLINPAKRLLTTAIHIRLKTQTTCLTSFLSTQA